MRKHGLMVMAMLGVLATTALPAHAVTWGGEVFGAFNTYTMDDWNDFIAFANASGADADEISNGFGGGLGIRVWPNSTWMVSATWEPMFASTEDNISGDELNLDGNSIQFTGAYFFPTQSKARFGLGAGLGYYMLGGTATSAGFPDEDIEGSTVGFHGLGMAEWEISPGFAMTGSAGYRVAKIADTELGGVSSVPETETDYSGVMVRAGLTFYMPTK